MHLEQQDGWLPPSKTFPVTATRVEDVARTNAPAVGAHTFEENYPEPVKQKVLDNWERWGFTTP